MKPAAPPVYPSTLLGAARAVLASADGVPGQHLKAHAALRLGYFQQARSIWEALARGGDAEALYQLGRMAAEPGLGEPREHHPLL
jgi:hypothetical protein